MATDIEPVLSGVLKPNVESNRNELMRQEGAGSLKVLELDWMTFKEEALERLYQETGSENIDLIFTADTIYHPKLVFPLFNVISLLLKDQASKSYKPKVLLGLERRDDAQVISAFSVGRETGLEMVRLQDRKVRRSVDEYVAGFKFDETNKQGKGWKRDDWEGVELWEIKLKKDLCIK